MSSSSSDLRLFGIDLGVLWQDLRKPWQNMHAWPVFAWLTPVVPVQLEQADGGQATWHADEAPLAAAAAGAASKAAQFVALQLPQDLALWRQLTLPAMPAAQTKEAVALEAQALSPFTPADLVWGYSQRPGAGATALVELALASRKQIETHLQTRTNPLAVQATPEVWVLPPSGNPIVMPGYGEFRRLQYIRKWRRFGMALLLLVFLLLAAVAVTPTAQLRFRAVEAVNAYTAVHQRTLPLAAQREDLVKTSERLSALKDIVSDRMDPLKVVELLTQALPDDTSLLGLQVQGLKVTMNGQTTNAAALMQHLSAQPGIREVRAPSAATRPLGVNKDSFSLEFTLDPAALAPASVQPQATASASAGANADKNQAAETASTAPAAPAASSAPAAPAAAASAPAASKPASPTAKTAP